MPIPENYTSQPGVAVARVTKVEWELHESGQLQLTYRVVDFDGCESMTMKFHRGSPMGKTVALLLQLAEAEIAIRHNL